MRARGIPSVVKAMSQQVWLWYAVIQLIDRSLVMSGVVAENDVVCSLDDTWGFTEGFIIWGGIHSLLLHRFGVRFGWVGLGAMEMPRQDVSRLFQYSTIEFQERRILFVHDGEYDIVRVAQHQHDGTTLGLVGNSGVTTLHNSITFRDVPTTAGGDHTDLPLGFS